MTTNLDHRFEELRDLAFGIAYRMLGTASDAEDVVQDAFIRLRGREEQGDEIRDPEAYLVTVVTRLAIDRLRTAKVRRESYVGTWLPEPLLTDDDPADRSARTDSLSMVVLLLLERLSPVERAVFVLREAFGYGYGEIAGIVDRSEENCRQIFVRGNRRVADGRPRFDSSPDERRRLLNELLVACEQGDLDGLVNHLAKDIASYADGGGKVRAYPRTVHGPVRTARLLLSQMRTARRAGLTLSPAILNCQQGLVMTDASGHPVSAVVFDIDRQVRTIHTVVNPDKLSGVASRG